MLTRNVAENTQQAAAFQAALLNWYDCSARTLPWRSEPLPYRVWVSEIMLQQTRVDTVLPYFLRFMEALPDIPSLAAAEEETLLKLWQGLGYYSRVRNLQKAARQVMERFGGELPSSVEELATLSGIGEYTAAAIASIAFGVPLPSVDGNLMRVLSRLTASSEDISLPGTKKMLITVAKKLLPTDRPGDFNQAMMDLGATICLPNGAPSCDNCPVSIFCKALQTDTVMNYPVKSPKKARQVVHRTVFVLLADDNRVLLQKRPPKGLLAGLPELPGTNVYLDATEVKSLLEDWGLKPVSIESLPDARHIFTHLEWHMRGFLVKLQDQTPMPDIYILASHDEVEIKYTLPTAFQAYFQYLP